MLLQNEKTIEILKSRLLSVKTLPSPTRDETQRLILPGAKQCDFTAENHVLHDPGMLTYTDPGMR